MNPLKGKNNIMCDLETMAKTNNAAIVSIGAVKFTDKKLLEGFYRVVTLQSCMDEGLDVDASTIKWWLEQSNEATRELLCNQIPLPQALQEFASWLGSDGVLWGNGATFDNVILTNAYKACRIRRPWSYRNDRCYRTISALYPDIEKESPGVNHRALTDAENQAKHIIRIFDSLANIYDDAEAWNKTKSDKKA